MKYLGIDYGSKHIGISLSDSQGKMAFPHTEILQNQKAGSVIRRIVQDENIDVVVVGDTRAFNGGSNSVTPAADQFIAALRQCLMIPVETMQEAGTSAEAARYAPKGHTHDNTSAAAIILQRYLDMRANRNASE